MPHAIPSPSPRRLLLLTCAAPLLFAIAFLLLLMSSSSVRAEAVDLVEGKNYSRLQYPQPTSSGDKVEVIEFFWYGCPHCANLDPFLHEWLKTLPPDVEFRKAPAVLGESWRTGAAIFYALEALGEEERLGPELFNAMAKGKRRASFRKDEDLYDWMQKHGVDRDRFAARYKSFATQSKVVRAIEATQEYGFGGVPALVVGGKYLPLPQGTLRDMLQVVDALIEKNRQEIGR